MNDIFTSSKTSEWSTPDWLYKKLDDEFHFDLDAACTKDNTKCKTGLVFVSPTCNALVLNWWEQFNDEGDFVKSIWCNPPYNKLEEWIKHGFDGKYGKLTINSALSAILMKEILEEL